MTMKDLHFNKIDKYRNGIRNNKSNFFMKRYFPRSIIGLACLVLSGCCLFSPTVAVEDAQAFVEEAIQQSMAGMIKIKQKPSKVAFSFYASQDVNTVIKEQKPSQYVKKPAVALVQPIQKTGSSKLENKKGLIKYKLQCDHSETVTFINCKTIDLASMESPDDTFLLNIQKIQQRKNNRLNIVIEPQSSDSTLSTNEYNVQCERNDPAFYQDCWHLPGDAALEKNRFAIVQVRMRRSNNQFEVLVEQIFTGMQAIPQRTIVQAPPQPKPLPALKMIETYTDPKPISFKILMLRDDSLLLSADQESLTNELEKTLGKNYIDHDDYVLTPGEFKFINFTSIDTETRYIGVIADYRDGTQATWKAAFKVEPTGSRYPLHVHLKRNKVNILAQE
jgi:type VI secretion system VasD/TssJ family lipoprotein